MSGQQGDDEPPQRRWWEEGCYCSPGDCVCGTERDPFRIDINQSER
jgi:hypothetical protein